MTPERFTQAQEIFTKASDLPEAEREPYLRSACGDDASLLEEVRSLLRYAERKDAFQIDEATPEPTALGEPQTIGRYQILERLGEGGMGAVFKAEQLHPIKRTVAIKIIKLGIDTKKVIARFELERQLLAQLDHPNIARVFDADITNDGRPYFVMEFVPGRHITEFADEHSLSIKDRLHLFIQVCDAISHAHTKAIIHRDIKPSNVLAHMLDWKPVVKVIDFGVAKALTSESEKNRESHTTDGQVVGTYRNMSPEQTAGSPDIDTRTDIYALGLLIYELLTGMHPFDWKEVSRGGVESMRQHICEKDSPPPSVRLSAVDLQPLTELSNQRHTDPARLIRIIRGDLDWIVMKCLEKERSRRYETVNAVVADLRRYLGNEPVLARPPTAAYRLRKLFRRNRLAFVSALTVTCTLILAVLISTMQAVRATRAERVAVQATKVSDARAEELRRNLYLADMSLAGDAAELPNGIARVRELLDHWRFSVPDLRGWEWYYLNGVSHPELLTLRGHNVPVRSVAWNQTSTRLASGGEDGIIKIWDAESGNELISIHAHRAVVQSLAWNPEGTRLATDSNDGTVKVWDVRTGHEELTISAGGEHKAPCYSVAWSPDGKRIASNGDEFSIAVWDATSGAQLLRLVGHTARIRTIAWSPDGKHICSGSDDGTAKTWDASSGEPRGTFRQPVASANDHATLQGLEVSVRSVAWSPDSSRLAIGCGDGKVRLCSASDSMEVLSVQNFPAVAQSVVWDPNGTRFALASTHDSTVQVYDAASPHLLVATFRGHGNGPIYGIGWSPDGTRIASASYDGTVKIWRPQDTSPAIQLYGHTQDVLCAAWSSDGNRLASGSYDQTIRIWDVSKATQIQTLQGHTARIDQVAWSPDGKRLASAGAEGVMKVWDAIEGRELYTVTAFKGLVDSVAWSPNGRSIATVGPSDPVAIWDATSGKNVRAIPESAGGIIAWSPDGRQLAVGATRIVQVWNPSDGTKLRTIEPNALQVYDLAWSPDSARLATAHEDSSVHIWEFRTGRKILTFSGHTAGLLSVAWSSDGKRIASACRDSTVRVWDPNTGKESIAFHARNRPVAWSPDNMRLACALTGGTICIYDATAGFRISPRENLHVNILP